MAKFLHYKYYETSALNQLTCAIEKEKKHAKVITVESYSIILWPLLAFVKILFDSLIINDT